MIRILILEVLILIMGSGAVNIENAQNKIRVTGYYAGWQQGQYNNGRLPANKVDFNDLDYIIHFALWPNGNGTIDYLSNSILQSNSAAIINAAHAAGKKVLICIGGWGSGPAFRSATSPFKLLKFVTNIIQFVVTRKYDGIDIDWEVLQESDSTQFTAFVKLLRMTLDAAVPGAMLTMAADWQPALIASLQNYFDQINLMTYDLSGPWGGWVTWFNSPVLSGNNKFPSNDKPLPSIDQMVHKFTAAGVSKSKIAVGIDFYGYLWEGGGGTNTGGVTAPLQSWTMPPEVIPNIPYYSIMNKYFLPQYYRWDSTAEAPYLDINDSCNSMDKFVTYDDEHECRAVVKYARKNNLGGVFIWELGAGVTNSGNQPLLNSIAQEVKGDDYVPATPVAYSPKQDTDVQENPVTLSWYPSEQANGYRIQVSSDSGFTSLIINSIVDTAFSIQIPNLEYNKKYYWRVSALNQSGESHYTTPLGFRTAGPQLAAPVLSTPQNNSKDVSVNTTFTWKEEENAGSYQVQIAASKDFCELVLDTLIKQKNSFTYKGLLNNKTYYWHIRAFPNNSSFSFSNFSLTGTFTTIKGLPGIVQIISPKNNSKNVSLQPVLSWKEADNTEFYELRLSLNSGFSNVIMDSTNITVTSIKLNLLKNNTTYFWDVRAVNSAGKSNWTSTSKFTTGSSGTLPLLTSGPPANYELMQNYPNPFNNSTIIEFGIPVASNTQLTIYNSIGQKVKTFSFIFLDAGTYEVLFYDSGFASGVYFYTIYAVPFKTGSRQNYFETKKMVLLK